MKLADLLRALADGKRIRHKSWLQTDYIYMSGDTFRTQSGLEADLSPLNNYPMFGWEILEPLLKVKLPPCHCGACTY